MRVVRCLFVCAGIVLAGSHAKAASRTVCSSGCQYSDLQAAIDAAVPGDTILLRAGQTFTGNFILRNKNTSSTQYITIRSDAADSSFPASGVRLIPEGKSGWNTRRSALARLLGRGGTSKSTAVVRTAAGAHHYRLQFLELDGLNNLGYETLVDFGTSVGQTTSASVPHSFIVDRVWFHGHPTKGMKRGIYLNSGRTDILNSYFNDFFSFSDAQAICGTNGPGPYRIVNNHLEAAAENILFGGEDPKIANLVPSDIEIRGNYFTKNLAWRNSILTTPGKPTVSSAGSGSLAAGTHYFKVTAVIQAGGGNGYSLASTESSITVGSGSAVRLSWSGVSKADKYRIYRGTSSNGQSRYLETTSTSFTYTGSSETSGTPKTSATRWTAKNLLELKNAQRVTVDGNVMENNWSGFQQGYAIVLTPRNQSDTAPWSVVRDVTFTNNTVRNVAAVFNILGRDYNNPSQLTRNIRIENNVFEKVAASWGNTGRFMVITEGPSGVTVDHNTISHESVLVDVANGDVLDFVFTNNMARHNTYGIKGQDYASGNSTINAYFPGAVVRGNVLAGGPATWYPSGNYFPSAASFLTQFVSAITGDWRLTSASTYNNKATDGTDIGADIGALELAQVGNISATPAGNEEPVADAGGPYTATAGSTFTANGGDSTDAEAPLVRYDWHFGEDILLRAADVPAGNIKGRWRWAAVSSAAGGVALENTNAGDAKKVTALASPVTYVEIDFDAGSGVPYYVWIRLRAAGDSNTNDSVHLQFDRSVNSSGSAIFRIGTTNSMPVVLEKCDNAGRSGWGWNDGGWCGPAAPIYFSTAGRQRIRIQQREDGVMFDQIVISAAAYAGRSPGLLKVDTTIVPTSLGTETGITAVHTYRRSGTYPLRLWVTDSVGQQTTTSTNVVVR